MAITTYTQGEPQRPGRSFVSWQLTMETKK